MLIACFVLAFMLNKVNGQRNSRKGEMFSKDKLWLDPEDIEREIKNHKVMIYANSDCPESKKAKTTFEELMITYKDRDLDNIKNGAEI